MTSLARVLGLISLRRTFARLGMMQELCGVLDGLWTTASAICWVMILCFFFLYMCSVFVTEQIGHNEDYVRYRKISGGWDFEDLFGTIGRSMLTLLQMMTLDSWSSQIARHVINMQWEMGAFFIIFLVLSTYGLLNIVISIIVEHMLQAAAKNDRKAKARLDATRKQELESIKEVFILSDTDGSGEVDLKEFLEAVKNPEVQWRMRQLGLPLTGAAKLFAVIDGDGSRTLTITEFINGCKKLKGTAQSKDLLVIQAQADILSTKMEGLQRSLEDSERMMQILDDINYGLKDTPDSALKNAWSDCFLLAARILYQAELLLAERASDSLWSSWNAPDAEVPERTPERDSIRKSRTTSDVTAARDGPKQESPFYPGTTTLTRRASRTYNKGIVIPKEIQQLAAEDDDDAPVRRYTAEELEPLIKELDDTAEKIAKLKEQK